MHFVAFYENREILTTEQFVEMFDKKESELDKWLRETKAKNLSLEQLEQIIANYFQIENQLISSKCMKIKLKKTSL